MMEPKKASLVSVGKSFRVTEFRDFNWKIDEKERIKYADIINYERAGAKGDHHCVMCGCLRGPQCVIPNQNKDVCKTCDSAFWLLKELNVLVKFCKGCKKFSALMDFDEKPEASKCGKCRKRGRQNYYSRKQDEDDVATTTVASTMAIRHVTKDKERSDSAATKVKKEKANAHRHNIATAPEALNKNALKKLNGKENVSISGETDKSLSSSSESCSSPQSYNISLNPANNLYHNHNNSFSSPNFNDTSDINILGFNPYESGGEFEDKSRGRLGAKREGSLKVPHPCRPNEGNNTMPPQQLSRTPNVPKGHNHECPDSSTSVVSCSSQMSDNLFSNSYLWPESLKELERNSLGGGAGGTKDIPLSAQAGANSLTNNQMLSCFQMPTGYPSAAKKSSGGVASKGNTRGPSRNGALSGVALDRRDSRGSGKSSNSSSRNSSLSSIGSAGGLPINHFGDLGGIGTTSTVNTPGLLLSITPQSGYSFTPQNQSGYDVITPFTGTPMFSHSPFDSINTPDSNWKWDPAANALMNLANVSVTMSNTPPFEDQSSPDEQQQQDSTTAGAGVNETNETLIAPVRKCSSDPGKTMTHVQQPLSKPPIVPSAAPPSSLVDIKITLPGTSSSSATNSIAHDCDDDITKLSDCRTSVMSDNQVPLPSNTNTSQMPEVSHENVSSSPPFPHIIPDDNIYQVAIDSNTSLELSPPVSENKKKRPLSEAIISPNASYTSNESYSVDMDSGAPQPVKKLKL